MENVLHISLIITTYNWPEALRLCLNSVSKQSAMPDEVIIADDGSSEDTRKVVDSFRQQLTIPLKHVWQEDCGYRRSAILNKALREVNNSNYVIFIDGDIILHKHFIADHARLAMPGHFVFGRRCFMSQELSSKLLSGADIKLNFFTLGMRRRVNTLRLTWLSPLIRRYRRSRLSGQGCNLGAWMGNIIQINGYNEDFVGWGFEDTDFICRLRNIGLVSNAAKFQAVVYHLWHQQRANNQMNSILEETKRKHSQRCANGLDKYNKTIKI